jgi:hypothetical protein
MITNRTVAWYSYASLAVMVLLLILMWQRMVPEHWYMTLFGVALVLFLVRVTLRLILARQQRLEKEAQGANEGGGKGA